MSILENLYFLSNGQEQGPYPAWEVLKLWNDKVLNADTQCRHRSTDSWQPLGPLMLAENTSSAHNTAPAVASCEDTEISNLISSDSLGKSVSPAVSQIESAPLNRKPIWKQILLWIAVLPGAVFGGWLAFVVSKLICWLSGSAWEPRADDFERGWNEIVAESMSGAALGYFFVLSGWAIAPNRKITVAITLAGLVLFLTSPSIFSMLAHHEWTALIGTAFIVGASIVCAVTIAKREVPF